MTAKTTTSLRGGGADAAIQYGACMGTAVASGTLDRHAPSALAMTAKGNTLDRHGLSGLAMTAKNHRHCEARSAVAIQYGACMGTAVAGCNGTLDRHALSGSR